MEETWTSDLKLDDKYTVTVLIYLFFIEFFENVILK